MEDKKRPFTADEIRYNQALTSIRTKVRDTIENSKESILGSIDAMISDSMDSQALITNLNEEIIRLNKILDKNKIPHERTEKKSTPKSKANQPKI